MRDIKFRAWDKVQNEMIPDKTINLQRSYSGMFQGEGNWIPMQYTGLKDKNGTEIYEGDILRFTYWWFDGGEAETELVGVVAYIPEEASYGLTHIKNKEWLSHIGAKEGDEDTQSFSGWQFSPDDIEVLGNIYEKPGLLEFNQ